MKLRFRLNEKQETLLADKILDLANYFAVGFIITQLLTEETDLLRIAIGSLIYLILVVFSLWLRR